MPAVGEEHQCDYHERVRVAIHGATCGAVVVIGSGADQSRGQMELLEQAPRRERSADVHSEVGCQYHVVLLSGSSPQQRASVTPNPGAHELDSRYLSGVNVSRRLNARHAIADILQ